MHGRRIKAPPHRISMLLQEHEHATCFLCDGQTMARSLLCFTFLSFEVNKAKQNKEKSLT